MIDFLAKNSLLAKRYLIWAELNLAASIIHSMRTVLLALMIVLLPLRGWMGDAMAISMMGMQLGASAQSHAEAAQAGEHADCAGTSMMAAPVQAPSGEAADPMAACESCSLCQACNSVVMGVVALNAAALSITQTSPLGILPHFTSAQLQRGQKPPIS